MTIQTSKRSLDRGTAIGIGALIGALVILIALIALITLLPARTISQTISAQASEQEKLLGSSLSRQMENHFNTLALDLLGLANLDAVRSVDPDQRATALSRLNHVYAARQGQIVAIVRITGDGSALYAWPDEWNQKIDKQQALPWSITKAQVDSVVQKRGVQFIQQRQTDGGVAFLLLAPLTEGSAADELIGFQIDLNNYFETNLKALQLSASSQMWVFDRFGNTLFQYREQPAFRGNVNLVRSQAQTITLTDFPAAGQESVVAPVYATFNGEASGDMALTLVNTHSIAEAQQPITNTLQSLFLFGMAIITFIVVFGFFIGQFLLRESRRRRQEEQRRATARSLLELSRALNSSLDLRVVLSRILSELGGILPHDSASIMLLNAEERTVTIAAETGEHTTTGKLDEHGQIILALSRVRGAREVVMTGKPTLINDCLNDPRWAAVGESKTRAWLGVPMRVRGESVGVLNINSHTAERFQPDDIDLAEAFADQAGVAIQNARSHEFQITAYETELETARAIQTSLLPQDKPPVAQLDLAARAVAARHVSGDYYQYYMLPDGRLGIAVGDVSGKGIPAALLMAVTSTVLRDEILRTPSPAALLNELNTRLLSRMQQTNMTSALVMSIFDPATRHVEVANAGMVQPYVYNGSTWSFLEVGGYPLGASSRMSYSSKTLTLAPGSVLLLISDGVIECQNTQREFFGFERLEALLNNMPVDTCADEIADTILEAVYQHLENLEPQDDITIVAIRSVEV